jgi:hypothetical protein
MIISPYFFCAPISIYLYIYIDNTKADLCLQKTSGSEDEPYI